MSRALSYADAVRVLGGKAPNRATVAFHPSLKTPATACGSYGWEVRLGSVWTRRVMASAVDSPDRTAPSM